MEVTRNDREVLSAVVEVVETRERIKKAEKEIFKQRVNELVASGVDRATAKVMVKAFISCNL